MRNYADVGSIVDAKRNQEVGGSNSTRPSPLREPQDHGCPGRMRRRPNPSSFPTTSEPAGREDGKMCAKACKHTQIEVACYCDLYLTIITLGQMMVQDLMLLC